MRPSHENEVRDLYENTADAYAAMMDTEIELPIYADVLGRLRERIADRPGPIVDSACGSGHMLFLYHDRYDQTHQLVGIDLSPRMVAIAEQKLGPSARVVLGDMRDLSVMESESSSALLNFYALHHLDEDGVRLALREWYRVLSFGGQLVAATWEGSGAIDYGDKSDIIALRYQRDDIEAWAQEAGFRIQECAAKPVEGFPMDAVYLEAEKMTI